MIHSLLVKSSGVPERREKKEISLMTVTLHPGKNVTG
jgi:hypothetical protein